MMRRRLALAAGLALAAAPALAPGSALAQRAAEPTSSDSAGTVSAPATPPPPGFPGYQSNIVFGGQVDTHLQAEFIKPNYSGPKYNVYNDTQLALFANYGNWLSLNSITKLERNRQDNTDDYFPDRNTAFRSEGLTQRQLYATVRPIDGVAVYGGKIHPNFGSAYDQAPGIFYNFGSDYEQDERIGIGTQVRLPERLGLTNARITLETFYLDTSFLSESLISRPGFSDSGARPNRYAVGQFGPANTGGLNSYTVSLRGGAPEQGLTYQLSFTREATRDPAGKTETGVSIGGSYDIGGDGIPLTNHIGVIPFLEYAHFDNFAGVANLERHYGIAGATFIRGRWNLNVVGGIRRSLGAQDQTDVQTGVSLTYEVVRNLLIGVGYNYIQKDDAHSHTLAPSLSYSRAF